MREPWNDFLQRIPEARTELGDPETIWYRGHSDSAWQLVPSLLRYPDGLQRERFLFREFQRSAARLFSKRDSDWETLFDMQHYGIPTRLLDWSEVLGVSLAFVLLQEYHGGNDCAVFVLDPVALNKKSGLEEVKSVPQDHRFDYQSIYWHNQPFAALHPIAVDPPFQNDRMHAQKGTFTVHGSSPAPLETQCPDVIRKVALPQDAKVGAREFLEYADLNAYSIYPDIVGMARHISRQAFGL